MSASDVARANVQLAQARLREAELDLGYTRVTASVSGMTGRALKSEGSLVVANSDSLLTHVSQVDPIYVNFSLSENQRLRIASEAAAGSSCACESTVPAVRAPSSCRSARCSKARTASSCSW